MSASQIVYTNVGLVADVQMFFTNASTNFGWLIKNQNEATSGARRIGTRSSGACAPTLGVNFAVPQTAPMTITSSSPLPNGTVGSPYSFTITVTNGTPPYLWAITSGTLPGGLTLSSAGAFSGTPANFGNFNFTVQVSDNVGASTNKVLAVTIHPSLRIDQVNVAGNQLNLLFAAQAGQSYVVEFRASLTSGDWQTLTNISAQLITTNVIIADLISDVSKLYRIRTP